MTERTVKRDVLDVPETGWTKARRRRGRAIRTCMAAVEDGSRRTAPPAGPDGNIVRGED